MTSLAQCHIFGLTGHIFDALHHLDDQNIIYPAGSNLVIFNIENKTQRFVSLTDSGMITALTVSSKYIAIAEKSDKRCIMTIFDLLTFKKKKVIKEEDNASIKGVTSLAFSPDSKYLAAQFSEPEWLLQLWNWEKGKMVTSTKLNFSVNVKVLQILFNPFEKSNLHISVVGQNIFKIFRYTEGVLKPITTQKLDHRNGTCHVWLTVDRLVISTEDGKILVYDTSEVKSEVSIGEPSAETTTKRHYLTCLRACTNGFIAGSNDGVFQVWEKSDEALTFKLIKETKIENSAILGMSLCIGEEAALCSLENNQLIHLQSLVSEDIKIEKVCQAHQSSIHGLDTCIRKPLLVTCGADHSVRIWNFLENTMEVVKFFKSEPYSVAFHPSGLYLLVGFSEGIKLLKILLDDLRPYWEFTIRGCRESRFSNGGQYFAVGHESMITVRSTWTFDIVSSFKSHTKRIKSLHWSSDDMKLLSLATEESVIEWNVHTATIVSQFKSGLDYTYQAAIYGPENSIYIGDSRGIVTELRNSQVVREFQFYSSITQLLLTQSGKYLIVGTATGYLKGSRTTFTSSNEIHSIHSHSSAVNRLRMSSDERFVLSAGVDACLCISKILDKEIKSNKNERDTIYSDEILDLRGDIKAQLGHMIELRQKVDEIRYQNEVILEKRDNQFTEHYKDVCNRMNREITNLKAENASLSDQLNKTVLLHMTELKDLKEKQQEELKTTEAAASKKLRDEEERYSHLQRTMQTKLEAWEKQRNDIMQSMNTEVESLRGFYTNKIKEKREELKALENNLAQSRSEHMAAWSEIDRELDQEVLQIEYQFEQRLKEERKNLKWIQQENDEMHKKHEAFIKQIEANKAELQKIALEEKAVVSIIKTLEKDTAAARRELQEREDTIEDKETRISDLKRKNKELEKFKFVLDYKIIELRKQIEPREQDIINLTNQLGEMREELEVYIKEKNKLVFCANDLQQKLQGKEQELKLQCQKAEQSKLILQALQQDLRSLFTHMNDFPELKRKATSIFHNYCGLKTDSTILNSSKENRERELLEKTAWTVHKKLMKQIEMREKETKKLIEENVQLTNEANLLRKEKIVMNSKTNQS